MVCEGPLISLLAARDHAQTAIKLGESL